jgi:hypothetical protein
MTVHTSLIEPDLGRTAHRPSGAARDVCEQQYATSPQQIADEATEQALEPVVSSAAIACIEPGLPDPDVAVADGSDDSDEWLIA